MFRELVFLFVCVFFLTSSTFPTPQFTRLNAIYREQKKAAAAAKAAEDG